MAVVVVALAVVVVEVVIEVLVVSVVVIVQERRAGAHMGDGLMDWDNLMNRQGSQYEP